jgi:hypothetical protein
VLLNIRRSPMTSGADFLRALGVQTPSDRSLLLLCGYDLHTHEQTSDMDSDCASGSTWVTYLVMKTNAAQCRWCRLDTVLACMLVSDAFVRLASFHTAQRLQVLTNRTQIHADRTWQLHCLVLGWPPWN